jgi:hypothetical protein
MRGLSNNRAGLHKEVGFLALILIAGCTMAPVKNWDCTYPDDAGKWSCSSLQSDRIMYCQDESYVVIPACIPEWCSLPMQSCDLPPLTGGTDSCGEPCEKPSEAWPNCHD